MPTMHRLFFALLLAVFAFAGTACSTPDPDAAGRAQQENMAPQHSDPGLPTEGGKH